MEYVLIYILINKKIWPNHVAVSPKTGFKNVLFSLQMLNVNKAADIVK